MTVNNVSITQRNKNNNIMNKNLYVVINPECFLTFDRIIKDQNEGTI